MVQYSSGKDILPWDVEAVRNGHACSFQKDRPPFCPGSILNAVLDINTG